ncbi:MAG: biopolymer transporter ExbD [Saprospiraceae bacterium]|nr:biopolymer transporter ExbD [Saprospiraceae bacterium]MBK7525249.1 biopolymer transporter ExbD [Saprospiraceae bacterium]MBK8817841.1 biopolymer transporter ExbD [Saprospiraceae bacterium]MBK9044253.1 biopolymer transporter ExbD [Saprospiraceae bacterium]MBP6695658.1 biopolymer transporter ExbD [Saprospiraceae bacterium]
MPIKKRNKLSAEFNMSSLTDIIFLLLIFFMLTSNLVQINVSLPKSESKTIAPSDLPVMLTVDGRVSVVGKPSSAASLEKDIATAVRKSNNKDNATVSIISEVGVPWKRVHEIMKIASGLKIKAIIATEPSRQTDKL